MSKSDSVLRAMASVHNHHHLQYQNQVSHARPRLDV